MPGVHEKRQRSVQGSEIIQSFKTSLYKINLKALLYMINVTILIVLFEYMVSRGTFLWVQHCILAQTAKERQLPLSAHLLIYFFDNKLLIFMLGHYFFYI